MFEFFETLVPVLRAIAHVAEWTGLSIGAVLALGLLAWYVPPVRRLAIATAIFAVGIYVAALGGYHVGRADVKADWDRAVVVAKQHEIARTAFIAKGIAAKYAPVIADLQKREADYDRELLAAKSGAATAGSCQLGAEPLRLRNRRR